MKINEKLTLENAKKKLKTYARWKRIKGRNSQTVTTTWHADKVKTSQKPISELERIAINVVSAENEIKHIEDAINLIDDATLRKILTEKYLKERYQIDQHLMSELGYGNARFYELQKKALIQFAESYRHGILIEWNIKEIKNEL